MSGYRVISADSHIVEPPDPNRIESGGAPRNRVFCGLSKR